MKRFLIIFMVLLSLSLKGQSLDSAAIIEKAKIYFKEEIVDKKFKNPYSYKLKKIDIKGFNLGWVANYTLNNLKPIDSLDKKCKLNILKGDVLYYEKLLGKRNLKQKDPVMFFTYENLLKESKEKVSKERENLIRHNDSFKNYKNILNDSNVDLNEVVEWQVFIDCIGDNSFGGSVYLRYYLKLDKNGSILKEATEL